MEMEKYLGVKLIEAEPLSLGDYNKRRGWTIPENEDPAKEGYYVVYPDGYVSWSPKGIFEEAYRKTDRLSFGLAIEALKKGMKVARTGWNGKGMFLYYVPGSSFKVNRAPLLGIYEEGTEIQYHAHIDMKTAQGYAVPWLASQTDVLADVLAEDWQIVE